MKNVSDNPSNVTISLREIEGPQLGRTLSSGVVGLENATRTLTLASDNTAHGETFATRLKQWIGGCNWERVGGGKISYRKKKANAMKSQPSANSTV